jgi:hypothetical protein
MRAADERFQKAVQTIKQDFEWTTIKLLQAEQQLSAYKTRLESIEQRYNPGWDHELVRQQAVERDRERRLGKVLEKGDMISSDSVPKSVYLQTFKELDYGLISHKKS